MGIWDAYFTRALVWRLERRKSLLQALWDAFIVIGRFMEHFEWRLIRHPLELAGPLFCAYLASVSEKVMSKVIG